MLSYQHSHYIRFKENHLLTTVAFKCSGCMAPETETFIIAFHGLLLAIENLN